MPCKNANLCNLPRCASIFANGANGLREGGTSAAAPVVPKSQALGLVPWWGAK